MQFCLDTFGGRCRMLAVVICALWLLATGPAWHYFGNPGIQAATISAVCCLFAGIVTFRFARGRQPRMDAFAVLWGTAFRGVFALLGVFVMQVPLSIAAENYLIWLGLFYLASLALETALLLRPEPQFSGPK